VCAERGLQPAQSETGATSLFGAQTWKSIFRGCERADEQRVESTLCKDGPQIYEIACSCIDLRRVIEPTENRSQ